MRGTLPAGDADAPGAAQVYALAWPMTLKAVFLHGIVVIDGWLVSTLGEVALAAMGLAAAVGGFVTGVAFAFSSALQIRTAQAMGTGDPVFRKSVLAAGVLLGLGIGLLGVIAILVFGRDVLAGLAPTSEVADFAWSYLSIFAIVVLAESVSQNLASHFNGCGRARIPLIGYCLFVPVNVVASVLLIHGYAGLPALGVAGAAMGSAIATMLQMIFLAVCTQRDDGELVHVVGWRRGSFVRSFADHIRFAWPIAVTFISSNFASRVCMLIYAQMSLSAFAAMTLIMPWVMVAGTFGMQWAQASGIIIAQLLGEGRSATVLDRFLSAAWRAGFLAAACVAAIYLTICLLPGVIYPSLGPDTIGILTGFAVILLVLPFPKQSNAMCGNTLRASGDTIYVMNVFVGSQWLFRVPATALAVLYFDIHPTWILSLLLWEEILKFPAFHRRLFRGDWKRSNVAA